jgi:alkylation response protein AidB-like acyl-CoA dehydrogenase
MENSFTPGGGEFLITSSSPVPFTPEDFSPESRLIGETADDFLRTEVLPHVERIESGDHALMHSLMQKAGELGLLGADVPEVYGGLGLDVPTAALIAEKINYQQSFALTHEAHTVIATLPLLYFGLAEQKAKYLPKLATGEWIGSFALSEANSGSDALALQTRATLSDDGTHFLLNGMKMWITNTAFASLFTVFAKVDEKVTAFLVERDFPGVSFGTEERKLGMKGTSTRRVILDNVRVPVENAMPVGTGHYAAFCALNLGRFKLEAGAVGGLKEVLSVCTAYAKQRKTFGKPLGEHGLVKHKLAEMAARTFALESMVYRLAGDLERVFAPIKPDAPDAAPQYHRAAEEYAIECNIVKVIGSEAYSELTDEAIQIHGGYGYTEQFPVARAWRDQRLLRIGEGANEIVRVAIVNQLLRRDKAGRLPLLSVDLPTVSGDDPLMSAASEAKQLALMLLRFANERLSMAGLLETQEVAAGIADVVCAAYALESVALRVAKIRATGNGDKETASLLGRVAALGHTDTAVRAAGYTLECLDHGDPFSDMTTLVEKLRFRTENPMHLRRELAGIVLERDGYPLS